jgi:hypothetical protein
LRSNTNLERNLQIKLSSKLESNNINSLTSLAQPSDFPSKNESLRKLSHPNRKGYCLKCQSLIEKPSINPRDTTPFQIEEAHKENERTIKKLMTDVQRYQTFLKSLMENYSLPDNLLMDMKEIIYEDELTHFDNNNEFFA